MQIKAIISMLVVALTIAGGILLPRFLIAQDPPLQLGQGSLHRVELLNASKCSATIRIHPDSSIIREVVINVPPDQCAKVLGEELAAQATIILQDTLDYCQLLSDLASDDTDKTTDPARPDFGWVFKGSDTYLCASPVKVLITWNGIEYNLEWRSTNAG